MLTFLKNMVLRGCKKKFPPKADQPPAKKIILSLTL
jgi:hypothetical protein